MIEVLSRMDLPKQPPPLPCGTFHTISIITHNNQTKGGRRHNKKFILPLSSFILALPPLPHSPIYFLVIGTIRPRPKARLLTFNTTPICQRLCSLARIIPFDSSASTIASACGETTS